MSFEPDSNRNELDWIAFRFVAGELRADEARSFEERLASDQAAQEAVSRATALSLCIAAARPVVEPRRSAPWESRQSRFAHAVTWLSIGVAATVAVWIGAALMSNAKLFRTGAEPNLAQAAPPSAANAVAWLQLRELDDSGVRIERELENNEPDEPTDGDRDLEPVVPTWVVDLAAESQPKAKP